MKQRRFGFFRRYRRYGAVLAADLAVLVAFEALKGNRDVMNALAQGVTLPIQRALAYVTYLVPFSVAELLYVTALGTAVLLVCVAIRCLAASRRKWETAAKILLGTACTVLSIYAALTLLWGTNYYTDTFQEKSGIYGREASVEELRELTEYFAGQLSLASDDVERDEQGLFAEDRQEIFQRSTGIYENSYGEFPFLEHNDRVPKPLAFSEVFSAMDFTGFYFPFTGEANLNVHCPAAFLPATIIHELGHQRGIASEQECNFLSVVVSIASDDPIYRYSGWLTGYVHLSNALYSADPEAWETICRTLPETVRQDLRYNSLYWASMESGLTDAAQDVYDSFLKNYGDSDGVQSYGMVVDMLVSYYLD